MTSMKEEEGEAAAVAEEEEEEEEVEEVEEEEETQKTRSTAGNRHGKGRGCGGKGGNGVTMRGQKWHREQIRASGSLCFQCMLWRQESEEGRVAAVRATGAVGAAATPRRTRMRRQSCYN